MLLCFGKECARLKVEYNEETSVRKSLSFEIEPEVVEREIDKRAREYARKVRIPGFRPGKVPPEVIRQRFRAQVLEDAAEAIVNRVVFEELEGRGLRPLASPKVTDLKIDESQPMTFRAVFETLPLVEVPEYRGLSVKARKAEVTDAQVEAEIERLREQAARYDPVEPRPAETGDFVMLDVRFTTAEGKPRHDENVLVEVGSKDNHPELNEGLAGMSPGETKQVRVVMEPAQQSPPKAERAVGYTVTLKDIKRKVVPPADDEFAKDLGEYASLAELREALRKRLLAAEEGKIERELRGALVDALVERATFEVPEALVDRHMSARTENAARGLLYQGIDPTRAGVDWKGYRESQREDSVKAAKADVLLDEIARREGIEALEGDVDAEVARLADRLRKPKETLRRQMEKEGDLVALRARIREDKTLDLLRANARLDTE
ncbi:MAG: trigger factor [Acidobacteria bacterium]|nr:MAG: trigger factor [Acidobacteriota bacterium]